MISLPSKKHCTGCGACAFVCSRNCIVMEEDAMGVILPVVDSSNCVECNRCMSVCPILSACKLYTPEKVFAARSLDSFTETHSASGGLASELYRESIRSGWSIVGAAQQDDFSVCLELTNDLIATERFRNSKYVFSTAYKLYPGIQKLLKGKGKAMVIGLPCQIAAIRKVFRDTPDLFYVDIVCHGTTPHRYLLQHVRNIEKRESKKAFRLSFRDPAFGTGTFTFSVKDRDGNTFYSKRTKEGDTYQYAYHRWISYRENCYHCPFARKERVGDISLADYPGLGRHVPFPYRRGNISCVLVNTDRGDAMMKQLIQQNSVFAVERPVEEAIAGNGQLRRPTPKAKKRLAFEKTMQRNACDFEKTVRPLMVKGLLGERIRGISKLPLRVIRKILKSVR